MIVIRRAQPQHIPQMVRLWCSSFGDSEQFVQSFYEYWFPRSITFAALDGSTVAGIVHRLPITVRMHGQSRKAYYLYAGGVDPDYRHRGIFRALLAEIFTICRRENRPAFQIPAEESLVPYYKSIGFRPLPVCREAKLDPPAQTDAEAVFTPLTAERFHALRRQAADRLSCAAEWDTEALSYILRDHCAAGGFAYAVNTGGTEAAVLGRQHGDTLYLTELTASAAQRGIIAGALCQRFSCAEVICRIPPEDTEGSLRCGMFYPLPDFAPEQCYLPIDLL